MAKGTANRLGGRRRRRLGRVRRSVAHFYGSGIIAQSLAPPARVIKLLGTQAPPSTILRNMAIPDYQTCMLPFLRYLSDRAEHTLRDAEESSDYFEES